MPYNVNLYASCGIISKHNFRKFHKTVEYAHVSHVNASFFDPSPDFGEIRD